MNPAIFLDRDGVIIENRANYVRSWDDVEIFPEALAALAAAAASPYKIIIVTNQSAVGRGIITRETAEGINARLVREIEAAGGRVDGVFMCPHAPWDGCGCRKPAPGMLLEATAALDVDLARSAMIGDALSDVEAGKEAGVGRTILLRSGRGEEQLRLLETDDEDGARRPDVIFDGLDQALIDLLPPLTP